MLNLAIYIYIFLMWVWILCTGCSNEGCATYTIHIESLLMAAGEDGGWVAK